MKTNLATSLPLETLEWGHSLLAGSDPNALTESENRTILTWWSLLSADRHAAAILRAATDPRALLHLQSISELRSQLPRWKEPPIGPAILAGLLANVNEYNQEMRFICRLGNCSSGRQPALSEIHFLRMTQTDDPVIFYRRIRRAILILNRAVDIPSLADCALNWAKVHQTAGFETAEKQIEREEQRRRLKDRWDREYCNIKFQ